MTSYSTSGPLFLPFPYGPVLHRNSFRLSPLTLPEARETLSSSCHTNTPPSQSSTLLRLEPPETSTMIQWIRNRIRVFSHQLLEIRPLNLLILKRNLSNNTEVPPLLNPPPLCRNLGYCSTTSTVVIWSGLDFVTEVPGCPFPQTLRLPVTKTLPNLPPPSLVPLLILLGPRSELS